MTAKNAKKLENVIYQIEDDILVNPTYVSNMTGCPLWAAFCDENKDSISEDTIILMAVQILARKNGITMSFDLDTWINRFKTIVLKHLLN